jgi:Skp family chaperone for outer membrane proteins
VLATILELKQSFNENIQSIGDKLETLSKKFEDENKMIKQEIMSKESEITQLKAALQEEKHANGRLRADIKLKSLSFCFRPQISLRVFLVCHLLTGYFH